MSQTPQLKIGSGLTIGYRTPLAKAGEEIVLEAGTHFLLARNGRGKTTLLRTLARTLKALDGRMEHSGKVQYLPEDLRFDAEIPARAIFRAMIPAQRLEEAMRLAEKIELDTRKPYGQLSTGNRRKTALIVAEFSHDPAEANILLLDEPFSGLDATAREAFEQLWNHDSGNTLRLVSCHPDYDSMEMPSALLIQDQFILHQTGTTQKWTTLKGLLN